MDLDEFGLIFSEFEWIWMDLDSRPPADSGGWVLADGSAHPAGYLYAVVTPIPRNTPLGSITSLVFCFVCVPLICLICWVRD